MTIMRVIIAQHERALVWTHKQFAGVLESGKRWIFAPFARVDFLVKEARETMEKYFDIVELTDREVGLVYKNGKLAGVLAPGKRQLYWKGPIDVRVEKIDLTQDLEVPANVARLLVRAKQPLAAQVADAVTTVEVADTAVAMLIVDGKFTKLLEPGLHVFWKFQRTLKTELIDRRVQTMEVPGQDILTRDKVSLRVNLTALWQVTDAVKARGELQNFVEFVYKKSRSEMLKVYTPAAARHRAAAGTVVARQVTPDLRSGSGTKRPG